MQHISYDNFFSCISIFGWTICCLCPSTYESTIPEGQVAAEVPLEQLQRWLWTSPLFKWLGMIIWLGQLLASMIFLRYHLWPFDHSPFIFMVVHLSLNWTSNCSAHGCPSKRQPFLSLVTRPPFCSDTARFGLGFFARHLSMAMPAMQLCYGSMDATIETRLGAHSTTP